MKGDALLRLSKWLKRERKREWSKGKPGERREGEREIKKEERKKHDGAGKVTTSRFNDQTLALTPSSFPPPPLASVPALSSPPFFFPSFFPEQTSSGIYTRATRGGKLARGQDSTCLHAPVLHRSSINDRLLIITTNEGIRLKLHGIASKNRIFCVTFFLVSCFIQDAIFITRSRLLLKG